MIMVSPRVMIWQIHLMAVGSEKGSMNLSCKDIVCEALKVKRK